MLNEEEDIFGEVKKAVKKQADRLIARDDPAPVEYSEDLRLAKETDEMTKEEGWHLTLQRPMGFDNAHRDWIGNATSKHGRVSSMNGLCYCSSCHLKKFPQLHVGDPVATASFSVEELKSQDFVGLYKPPPPHIAPCPLCGEVIESYEEVDKKSEMVHVKCLSSEEKEVLEDVGYNSKFLIRKRREDHAPDSEMAGGSSGHECPECRCAEQDGGEPVQGSGEEEGPLVEEGAGRAGERPDERRVDVHPEEAGEGTTEGPEQAGAGGEEGDAEVHPDQAPVLHSSGVE